MCSNALSRVNFASLLLDMGDKTGVEEQLTLLDGSNTADQTVVMSKIKLREAVAVLK